MPRALISVTDKRGIVEFGKRIVALGWDIVSTGGTASILQAAGVPVTSIEHVTGFPEILDGRVKTLHPAVHAALLARRDLEPHLHELAQHNFALIDMVVVNLYSFRERIAVPDVKFEDAIEQIDIGGPTMLRAAAKNHASVLPVVDPRDYNRVLAAIATDDIPPSFRRELASKVFSYIAAYDAAIAAYLGDSDDPFPPVMNLVVERVQELRYGENPDQRAALYSTREGRGVDVMRQLHGKELSFNNLLDIDATSIALSPWPDRPACVVIKHTTPCGIALGRTPGEACRRALATDPQSAFGSVIGVNTVVDADAAAAMSDLFVEVVVAPRFHDEAAAILGRKRNLRLVEIPLSGREPTLDFKRLRGGFLVQYRFIYVLDESTWKTVSARKPSEAEMRDLRFAWGAVASVKSNAILLAKDEAAIGIGAGQMSRVDASMLAVQKARAMGHDPTGSVLASDAFFPFPDGVEQAADAGVTAIIQPGGSIRDELVVAAANDHGLAMVVTGTRQFRH